MKLLMSDLRNYKKGDVASVTLVAQEPAENMLLSKLSKGCLVRTASNDSGMLKVEIVESDTEPEPTPEPPAKPARATKKKTTASKDA